jgi:hypothetical protein
MKSTEFGEKYWNYYLNLESDFLNTQRYISIDPDNYYAFSIEYAKQYQTICSELDVICKQYCKFLSEPKSALNILGYANVILNENSKDIKTKIVKMKNISSIIITPWKDWNSDPNNPFDRNNPKNNSPVWWTMYNKVKHNRTSSDEHGKEFFKHANLFNTMSALAGLFIIEMFFYKDIVLSEGDEITKPDRPSKLFFLKDWEEHITIFGNGLLTIGKKDSKDYPEVSLI